MKIDDYHDFFVASSGVAGALIGLLFVAISVSQQRLAAEGNGAMHRVRASASLTAFTNALVVSLFGLIPGIQLGDVAETVSIVGLFSVVAIVISLIRSRALHLHSLLDGLFVAGLAVLFGVQLATGLQLQGDTHSSGLQTLAILVVICFLVGVSRAWELIGGPAIGLRSQVGGLGHDLGARMRSDDSEPS